MSLEKIMSKDLVVANFEDSLSKVASLMREYDIGFIPVERDKRIVGVITDRDIAINSIGNNELDCKVESYMTRNLISIDINDTVDNAIDSMGEHKIKRLLVNENGYLVGIISLSDIINLDVDNQLIIDNLKKIWEITINSDRMTPKVNEFKL